jgi:hypothetical protein
MIWKEFGRKQSWPNFEMLSQHLPGGTEENYKEKISSLWAEILTPDLSNIKQEF